MPDFEIVCPADPAWKLRLENCDDEHAASVLDSLEQDPTARQGLELHRLTDAEPPQPRRRFWRRGG